MNANELLRIVDSLHRDKNVDKEVVFQAIEAALVSAAKKHYGDESDIVFSINREDGTITGSYNDQPLDFEETIGRIGAQMAKQVIIQKVREAERDALIEEYSGQVNQMVSGVVQRSEGPTTTVSLGNVEALLPRSEQIPGEAHHPNERLRALIIEVKPAGSRVKVVLSRTRPLLVQRLFEHEIPEIADGVITVNAIAREPGYRSKVAVSSLDQRVDCVGACVGVRGNRIKNIVDELAGERIDIVRYHEDPQVLITNALQPAQVDEVILCQMMGRAIVLVREDQLSLAIGRRGQNVRLASKLCGWDIEIMTQEELEEQIDRAVQGFSSLEGVDEELANRLVGEGYLSYDDLSVIEPDDLMEMGNLTAEQVDAIVAQAEERALEAEQAAAEERRRQRELEQQARAQAAQQASQAATTQEAEAGSAPATEQAAAEAATAEEQSPTEAAQTGPAAGDAPRQDASAAPAADDVATAKSEQPSAGAPAESIADSDTVQAEGDQGQAEAADSPSGAAEAGPAEENQGDQLPSEAETQLNPDPQAEIQRNEA